MVSFDVKSLFTSVPLDYTIDIITKRIFKDHEITTIFTKSEMKKLLTLCTKNVHFSFNNEIYIQLDRVAMGSPLGPVIANIFMVELETTLVPRLEDHVQKWRLSQMIRLHMSRLVQLSMFCQFLIQFIKT